MRKAFLVFGLLLVAQIAHAQNTPQWEIFGGYSFLQARAGGIAPPLGLVTGQKQNANGWHFSATENVASWFGAVAEISGHYASRTVNLTPLGGSGFQKVNGSAYTYLFGPQFSYRKFGSAHIFGHVLFGGVTGRASAVGDGSVSETHWAFAVGGGIDWKVAKHLAVRIADADWIRSHFVENPTKDTQNNWRISAGLVLRVGAK